MNSFTFDQFDLPLRDSVRPVEQRQPNWNILYDDTTFIYDIVYAHGLLTILSPPLRDCHISFLVNSVKVNGVTIAGLDYCHYSHPRLSKIVVNLGIGCPLPSVSLLDYCFFPTSLPASLEGGRNILYTMQKDMHMEWIRDWARHHIDLQSAERVVIYDNLSTRYSEMELQSYLLAQGIPATVCPFDFRYGAGTYLGSAWDSDYCQYAALEHVRALLYGSSCVLLSIDVDETVITGDSGSIFSFFADYSVDMAPVLVINGVWLHPPSHDDAQPCEQTVAHHHHAFIDLSEKMCATKYVALVDEMPVNAFLGVHNCLNVLNSVTGSAYFLHHKSITTGWKRKPVESQLDESGRVDLSGFRVSGGLDMISAFRVIDDLVTSAALNGGARIGSFRL